MQQSPAERRPDNREVENEALRPQETKDGPPRPASEPKGSEHSVKNPHTETDPGTGEQ